MMDFSIKETLMGKVELLGKTEISLCDYKTRPEFGQNIVNSDIYT